MTMDLIEQNATLALHHSHRGYVLETGRISLQGKAQKLMGNEHIRKAYLLDGTCLANVRICR